MTVGSILMTSCSSMKGQQSGNKSMAQNARSDSAGVLSQQSPSISPEILNQYTSGWPEISQKAAKSMLEKYGQPSESTPSMLIWRNVSPYKRIIVYRNEVTHKFPILHKDVIEHVVDYRVPVDKVEEITRFDGSVYVDRTRGELSARCDQEAMNNLALNLASEIIAGRKQAQEARTELGRVAFDFLNGNQSPFTQGLQFGRQINTADADQSSKIHWASPDQPTQRPQAQEALKKQAQEEEMTE